MELLTRMLERGGAIGWAPTARVRHIVPAARHTGVGCSGGRGRRAAATRSWRDSRAAANSVTRELRSGSGALVRGWSSTCRVVVTASERQAAMLDDVVQRTRRLGRVAQTLSDGHDQRRR